MVLSPSLTPWMSSYLSLVFHPAQAVVGVTMMKFGYSLLEYARCFMKRFHSFCARR